MATNVRLLRKPEVKSKTGLSDRGIYYEIQKGRLPSPVKIGDRASAWPEHEVDRWIAARIAERDTGRAAQ